MMAVRPTLALIALVAAPVPARAQAGGGWGWGAVPFANYDADAGYGLGAVGTLTLYRPRVTPYRASLTAQLFVTSERVQGHELRWDVVGVGGPRWRLYGRTGYFATVNRNYCGLGNAATCDLAVAEAAADAAGLTAGSDERTDFVRRYYRIRYIVPFLHPGVRVRLDRSGHLSAFAQWRLWYQRSGTLRERGAYPGSLYELDYPDGEPGWGSVPQAGIMYDTRDSESAPARGVWFEASARAAAAATGSDWTYAGANVTTRIYHPLGGRTVSATRLVADGMAGDPPVSELGAVNAAEGYVAFGGATCGRGIREHRYLGRIKLLAQQELRTRLSRRWAGVAFVDAGWVAVDWDEVGGDPDRIRWSTGGGLRYVVNPTFMLRADLGVSPVEDWAPQLYLYLGHLY
jgi:hypothetical protein